MKIENKIIHIGLILLNLFMLSCNDFLNQEPLSNGSVPAFYKTETDIKQAVSSAYNSLMDKSQYGTNFIFLMEIRSDNSYTESVTTSGGIYGDIDLFRETSYNSVLNETWIGCYDCIKRCNIVLDRIDNATIEKDLKDKYIGEMLFIRALTYFNMIRIWGNVPLVVHYFDDPFDAFKLSRTSINEVYEQIKSDLITAANLLPNKVDPNRLGAALSGTAKTLLGKVYLTQKDFSNAIKVLKEVIDSNQYSFIDNYTDIFDVENKNNVESIFEIQYTEAISGLGSAYANIFAPIGSSEITDGIGTTDGNNMPTEEFYASYEENDLRRDISIGRLNDGRLYCKKFVKAPVLPKQSDANFIVLRYTDVLLMYAEALNEIGYQQSGDAFNILNKIRKRAGLTSYTSADLSTQTAFRNAIWKERRYEFSFENQRWFDLLRAGNAIEVINASTSDFKIEPYQLLFPIPQSQIDVAPNIMIQNENY